MVKSLHFTVQSMMVAFKNDLSKLIQIGSTTELPLYMGKAKLLKNN